MPWYRKYGKILTPITEDAFIKGMKTGHFCKPKHKGYCALLYYSAVRRLEALRSVREQYQLETEQIIFEVGKRLKHGIKTPPLNIPLTAPYANEIWNAVLVTKPKMRVFPYCDRTAYNIVSRAFKYPHLFRLSRITRFFLEGWTIAQVRSWTGLSLQALNYYLGLVDIKKMGESLG